MMKTVFLLLWVIVTAYVAPGQALKEPKVPADPLSDHARSMWSVMSKDVLIKAAEKMPEEHYSFRPVGSVRTFGQLVGHLADAQNMFCSLVAGEKNPSLRIEETNKTKPELIAALTDARTRCDKVYAGLTDSGGRQTVKVFGTDMPKFGVLSMNMIHSSLHYGNMITYLRIKGLVPPTSEPGMLGS